MSSLGAPVMHALSFSRKGIPADVFQIGIPDRFIQQGDNLHLYQECGMDEESILNKIEERLKRIG